MKKSDLNAIEKALQVDLPGYYKEFVLRFPKRLLEARRKMTWGEESPTDLEFLNQAKEIIRLNREVRDGEDMVETADDSYKPWPETHFVIGHDHCGNYYAINIRRKSQAVLFFVPETARFEKVASSLNQFVDQLLNQVDECNSRVEEEKEHRRREAEISGTSKEEQLILAIYYDDLEQTEQLLAAGANPNYRHKRPSELPETPLSVAICRKDLPQLPIVMALLSAGANPNDAGSKRRFPLLHAAACSGRLRLVKALLAAGADPGMKFKNKTALGYAREFKKHSVVKYLKTVM